MITTNTTKTIYIDMWNLWHLALMDALILSVTKSFLLEILSVILITIYNIKMADWTAPHVEIEGGLPGVTISPVFIYNKER